MLEYIYMIYKIGKEIPLVINIACYIYTARIAYKAKYEISKRLARARNC